MKHPAELALHQYMEDAANGKSTMSVATIQKIGLDVWLLWVASLVGAINVMSLVCVCQM